MQVLNMWYGMRKLEENPYHMSWKAGKYTFYIKKTYMLKTTFLKSGDRHVDKPLYS